MLQAEKKTGLVFFPAFDWAISPTHPEREERLLYTRDQILEEGLLDIEGIVEFKPEVATPEDIHRVHFCAPPIENVATRSHFISAGAAKTLGDAVLQKRVERGFVLSRPPGHHAGRVVHGARGFCNINNEAIMVDYLRKTYGIRKIAIVDTDCHHGDGTQDIYWHDRDILFISIHQDGRTLYPGTGFQDELGGPNAVGTTINIPLPPHTSDEGFLYALNRVVMPILRDFNPELIVNSAGQDNHYSDPITSMNFSAKGYAELTRTLQPDIAVLEGGYSIEGALPYINVGIILALSGLDTSHLKEPFYDEREIAQSAHTSRKIEKICSSVLEAYENRENIKDKIRQRKDCSRRQRRIYYDTDRILETQTDEVTICESCSGAVRVESSADNGRTIAAVHIPFNACKHCSEKGYEWFEALDCIEFSKLCLQDQTTHRYFQKNCR